MIVNYGLSGHRVHRFPNKKKDGAIFRASVRFVPGKRRDFTSASALENAVVCSVHYNRMIIIPAICAHCPGSFIGSPGPPSACGSAASGKHDAHGSVGDHLFMYICFTKCALS